MARWSHSGNLDRDLHFTSGAAVVCTGVCHTRWIVYCLFSTWYVIQLDSNRFDQNGPLHSPTDVAVPCRASNHVPVWSEGRRRSERTSLLGPSTLTMSCMIDVWVNYWSECRRRLFAKTSEVYQSLLCVCECFCHCVIGLSERRDILARLLCVYIESTILKTSEMDV